MTRRYSELRRLHTFNDRFEYLRVGSRIGDSTFGFERFLNQHFYRSREWKRARSEVIARDLGLDLGITGHEIYDKIIIHHMNPMTIEDVEQGNPDILDPEFLISTSHNTHNAIHFGDSSILRTPFVERTPGDTMLWSRSRKGQDA